ncbi:MAG: serine hydrolase domain-containing protein [Blastocatellia bacterium]|nr:serine hydrolase domain-containing protein [Blastocatellia bacterium]
MMIRKYRLVRFSFLLAILLCALAPAFAQTPRNEKPESVGVSAARLQRINRLIEQKIKDGKLVNAITLVARRGKLVHFETFGKADVEADKPLKKDAIFRIYSMTKPITTLAAMMLYEEGRFQLNDPLYLYLPEFRDVEVYQENGQPGGARVKPRRPISPRDLMSHTAGLTYGAFGDTPVDRQYRAANLLDGSMTLADFSKKVASLPLLFHPGERWNYGVNTDILGRLVEALSGVSLDEFFRERIFKPLGMNDTAFEVPAAKLDRFPVTYQWDGAGKRVIADHPGKSRFASPAKFYSGGGGLVSTASDYLRFCQLMLNGGELDGVRLLSPKTVQLMTMNHTAQAQKPVAGVALGDGAEFGLGYRVIVDAAANQRVGSSGTIDWGGFASTSFFIDPKEQLIGILMTQKLPTDNRLTVEFRTAVYQAIIESYLR